MSDEIDLHLGKLMRRRRRLLGLTQQRLADACGVRFQQIQKYECGANRISAARLWRVAKALEVSVEYFFEGLGEAAGAATETKDAPRAYRSLETPRRRLIDVARTLATDNDAA